MDIGQCKTPEDEVPPQALAFTVTFGSAKTTNKFIKRHSRNFSLPVVKVYENQVIPETTINGKTKKAGNHSEGYFSSDAEDDQGNARHGNIKTKVSTEGEVLEENKEMVNAPKEDAEEEEGSDVGSETGTYTIDKETPEVVTARLSIDANFGIDPSVNNSRDPSTWINEWATATANQRVLVKPNTPNLSSIQKSTVKTTKMVSKIPSPMTTRARLGSRGKKVSNLTEEKPISLQNNMQTPLENSYETESYLKTTEKAMTAIAARMNLSLDSGGESDAESKSSKVALQRSDSSASESGPKPGAQPPTTRYNRAFSLRRGRLEDSPTTKKSAPPPAVQSSAVQRPETASSHVRSTSTVRTKPTTPVSPMPVLTRTDNARLSLRAKISPQSPLLSGPRPDLIVKKKQTPVGNQSSSGGGGRSNSTLSSKEVEFQNWKRRKNYDPMKAAAEGKRKEAAKKSPVNVMTQSTTTASTTPKSPVTAVLRSASFHGTRQLAAPSSSEDDEEETLSAEDEDWPVLQAPKTSLENSPRSSRVSLYSNNSNSPRARHKLEGVDNLVVSAVSGLSSKLKVSASTLLKKLRYLYDEESEKYKELNYEIEQLEQPESSGSPQKSSSRELAIALKNLKRLDTTLKVLNDVLFENVDYE
ncbi:uncharacterized protein isoform X2 [Rhodnius prolixus]|uniref:uncharacterized protein isoform X2 n=1 Tax=Rhodnius prolixus TaxID=13249 RepID=UPI003D188AC2